MDLPDTIYIGIGTVLGASISIFGVWLNNRSSIKQLIIQYNNEKKVRASELKREKLEELYILVDKWLQAMFSQYLTLSLVMEGEIDYNSHLDQVIENGEKQEFDFSRLQMLVDIYSHELKSGYQKLMDVRDNISKITSAHKIAYQNGNFNGKKYLASYTFELKNLEMLCSSFKQEIAEHAKRT